MTLAGFDAHGDRKMKCAPRRRNTIGDLSRLNRARGLQVEALEARLVPSVAIGPMRTSGLLPWTTPRAQNAASTVLDGPGSAWRALASLPLQFEANRGQFAPDVRFAARGPEFSAVLSDDEFTLSLRRTEPHSSQRAADPTFDFIEIRLLGANPNSETIALEPAPGQSHYLFGSSPAAWVTNVPRYERVRYDEVYPGIDLDFYGSRQQLEYDFLVSAGADPSVIRLEFAGLDRLELDAQGNLLLHVGERVIRHERPFVFQEIAGERRQVPAAYVPDGGSRVAFSLGDYDSSLPLVIDPVIAYSTFLGDSGTDVAYAVALDSIGNAYVTGLTDSARFPTRDALQRFSGGGDFDAFVTKVTPDGSGLDFSTYLGGSGLDQGFAIAVDQSGNVYVAGITDSPDFPTANASQTSPAGSVDGFVAKLDATGKVLAYSTYLGGTGFDGIFDAVVAESGELIVVGGTDSIDFPTAGASANSYGGGLSDAFVTKLRDSGTTAWSRYLGGSGDRQNPSDAWDDAAVAVRQDEAGNVVVAGLTASSDFPTAAAVQDAYGGGFFDAFVTKLDRGDGAMTFGSYLGGSADDLGFGVGIDDSDRIYVTGMTDSDDIPTQVPFQPARAGGSDAFVVAIDVAGPGLIYATYLGGSGDDVAFDLAVNSAGFAHITGWTNSTDFPIANAIQDELLCTDEWCFADAFAARLSPRGDALEYSTFLGGIGTDAGWSIATDDGGNVLVAGSTDSFDFPLANAYQCGFPESTEVFVTHLIPGADQTVLQFEQLFYDVSETDGLITLQVIRSGDTQSAVTVRYEIIADQATPGSDYDDIAGVLDFEPGITNRAISIAIRDDDEVEEDESAFLLLSCPGHGAILGLQSVAQVTIESDDIDTMAPVVTGVELVSNRRGIAEIVVKFSEPMEPERVRNLREYLFVPGEISDAGDRDETTRHRSVRLRSATYDAQALLVRLTPSRPLLFDQPYDLIANNMDGLVDRWGNALDGDSDGVAGGAYRASFGRGTRLSFHDADGDLVAFKLARGGLIELWSDADKQALELQLIDTVPGRSVLTGRVRRNGRRSDGMATVLLVAGTAGVRVDLPDAAFQQNATAAMLVDRLLERQELSTFGTVDSEQGARL